MSVRLVLSLGPSVQIDQVSSIDISLTHHLQLLQLEKATSSYMTFVVVCSGLGLYIVIGIGFIIDSRFTTTPSFLYISHVF